jgi:hypothetical protein
MVAMQTLTPNPIEQLGHKVLQIAAAQRDCIGDSDLDNEQPVSVTISTTLGLLRKAGLRYIPAYAPHPGVSAKDHYEAQLARINAEETA